MRDRGRRGIWASGNQESWIETSLSRTVEGADGQLNQEPTGRYIKCHVLHSGKSPGLHRLNSVEGPGLKGGPGRAPRGAQGEVHLDLDIGIAEKERTT